MLTLANVILSPGPKGFFENPGYLIGLPLVILGAIGLLIAFSPVELRWPQRQGAAAVGHGAEVSAGAGAHPGPAQYVRVAVALVVVEVLEVVVFYADVLGEGLALAILLLLTVIQFALVALWFMHLRFDSKLFSILFVGGLLLVAALFFIVLASLGASLV